METNHAPLPWKLDGLELRDANDKWLTTFDTGNGKKKAEAELTVLAANSHEELLGALKGLLNELQPRFMRSGCNPMEEKAVRDARKAIAKAEGK